MIAWWYAKDGKPVGPHDFDALMQLYRAGVINAQTQLWHEGMAAWRALAEIPELRGLFTVTTQSQRAPDPMRARPQPAVQPTQYAAQSTPSVQAQPHAQPYAHTATHGTPYQRRQNNGVLKAVGILAALVVLGIFALVAGGVLLSSHGSKKDQTNAQGGEAPTTQTQTAIIASTAGEPDVSPEDNPPAAQPVLQPAAATGAGSGGQGWQNPVTHVSASIDPMWRYFSNASSSGQVNYMFTDGAQKRIAKFTVEQTPKGVSFQTFIHLFLEKTASQITFIGTGDLTSIAGHQAWEIDGHLKMEGNPLTHVQLVKVGDDCWQIMTLRQPNDAEADKLLEPLREQLWHTVL
jgi:hypothetical protein